MKHSTIPLKAKGNGDGDEKGDGEGDVEGYMTGGRCEGGQGGRQDWGGRQIRILGSPN